MTENKTESKQEQGRSMTEMLGVLAIIGVLSIGGIAGYTYAMNKHYANELLAGASERFVLVAAQIAAGREASLKEFANHITAGGTFATSDESVRVYSDGIGFEVSGVKGAVCENLIKATEDTDIVIADANDVALSADDCDDENDNTLVITFEMGNGSGETGGCSSDDDCGYCQHCESSQCVKDDVCDNGCTGDTPIRKSDGSCMGCVRYDDNDTYGFPASSQEECDLCSKENGLIYNYDGTGCRLTVEENCPTGVGFFYQGRCHSCTGTWSLHSVSSSVLQECVEACPNRVIDDDGWGDACILPKENCDFLDKFGHCRICGKFTRFWANSCQTPCEGVTFSFAEYYDQCVIDCGEKGYGDNVARCCTDNEVYNHIGTYSYGHPYGKCCPASRPVWNGSACSAE